MHLLAITTVFRTVLIILGVILLMRFLGQFMIAKRNMEKEREMMRNQRLQEDKMREAQQNFGKTTVSKIDKKSVDNAEYTDFEELD